MKKLLTTIVFLLEFFNIEAQTNWVQKQNFPGDSRLLPTTFTIDSKGYVTGGYRNSTSQPTNENWEYNAQTNLWTIREPVPGVNRWGAIGFTINGKGYVGGGNTGTPGFPAYVNDFWEYNPSTDSWVVKQNIGDHARYQSTSFVMNDKGYVALGYRSAQGDRDKSVWRYDPIANQWTKMGDVPDNMANNTIVADAPAVEFVLNNNAFLTGGAVNSQTWAYNPSNDSWVKKKDVTLNAYSGFSMGNKGYAVGERYINNQWEDVIMRYDYSTNQWSKVDNLPSLLPSQVSKMYSVTPCETQALVGSGNGRFYEFTNTELALTSGPSFLCNNQQGTFTLSSVPAGMNVTWSKWSGLSIVSGQGTSSVTVQANTIDGNGWVQATLSNNCGSVALDKYYFSQGEPSWSYDGVQLSNGAYGASSFFCTSHTGNNYIIDPDNNLNTHQVRIKNLYGSILWTSPIRTSTSGTVNYYPSPGYYLMDIRATNSCGTSSWIENEVEFVDCSIGGGGGEQGEFSVFPNPIEDGIINVFENNDKKGRKAIIRASVTIELIDKSKGVLLRESCNEETIKIDVSRIKKGTYFLRIIKEGKSETKRIVIN